MPTAVVTREYVFSQVVLCLDLLTSIWHHLANRGVLLSSFNTLNILLPFFVPILFVHAGNSRICLPDHFHYRDISEDYCLWPGYAPKLLRQKWLEYAGLRHRHSGVSPQAAQNIYREIALISTHRQV